MRISSVLTCLFILGLSSVSANYVRNIDDEIKIRAFTEKLEKYLETSNNGAELKIKYQKIISEKLGKNHDELKGFWPNGRDEYKSLKEYFLMNIYLVFTRFNNTDLYNINQYPDFKILENDYIRTIGKSEDLHIDNNSLYSTVEHDLGYKGEHLFFLEIDKDISLLEYLEENIFEEKFLGKCNIVKNTSNHMEFGNNITGLYFKASEEYQNTFGIKEVADCGKYGYGVFTRMSDTLVFYKPWPIEYVGLDFSLIEIKD